MKKAVKKLLKPIANWFRKITYKLMRNVISRLEGTIRTDSGRSRGELIPFHEEELIRIMFLFQAASFWPSWESFYYACVSDPRIRVEFTLLEELYGDKTQMLTAKQFLDSKGIAYKIYTDNLFAKFSPHVLIMQTPYDYGHRKPHVRSGAFKKRGTRIVYIPYGIELSDTEHARDAHFLNAVVRNAWRVFTFSERMRQDYRSYCPNYAAVKCFGHPKFDALYHKEQFSMGEEIKEKVCNKKILVWHVHFPKLVPFPDGSQKMATPDLEIYLDFARYIVRRTDVFTVLLPHPKFLDGEEKLGILAREIVDVLSESENAYVDWSDDYRNSLLNCDCFITDRSALMIEAAVTRVPILYMTNEQYWEPLTPAIQPLMQSYCQGNTFRDMCGFVETWLSGNDPKKEMREKAFKECIPYFDGKSGERIKEHIVDSLIDENENRLENRIKELESELCLLNQKLDILVENLSKGE